MRENRLLEQELNSVKELSVRVARWLMHGPPVDIQRLCREQALNEQVQHRPSHGTEHDPLLHLFRKDSRQ
jgi:hypothetical protein